MPQPTVPGFLMLASLAGLVVVAAWRFHGRAKGRRAGVRLWEGVVQLPRRYLVDVHAAVRRDPVSPARGDDGHRSAAMHAMTAGGFVAATLLIVLVHVAGLRNAPAAALLLAALAVMAGGVTLEFLRRVVHGLPPRLLHGPLDRLPWAFAAFIAFFAWATLPLAGVGGAVDWHGAGAMILLVLGGWACVELYAGLGGGPMRHAASGALHLAFHPRPERFGAGPVAAALEPVDLAERRLGVAQADDFTWNRLLGFDACVACGRCEAACPAFAAGQPLSPRRLILSLAEAARRAAAEPGGVVGREVRADALWACTTCRACVYECPMMIEHVDAVVDLRRFQTMELAAVPDKAAQALEDLRVADTVGGRPPAARLNWAADLNVPVLADVGRCDVLLWVGEGGFDLRNQRTLRALVKLLRAADVDFAVLGDEELDCGDLARRLGDEATFQGLARRNIAVLDRYAFERIVTSDPHVLHTLKSEYPALGGHYLIEHHTRFLARLIRDGRLEPRSSLRRSITYHDPCYLGRYQGEFDASREILAAIGANLTEMARSRQRSSCCGWGGGAAFTDVPGKRRIPEVRMDHARATRASAVAVACPNCAVMLEGVVQPRPDVTDVAELLLAAVERTA